MLVAATEFAPTTEPPKTASGARFGLYSWLLSCAALGLITISLPALLGIVYVADDLGAFHLPLRAFYSRQLSAGQSWDWMSSLFGGFYLTGEGQLGGYHPLHWVLYRCLSLDLAFSAELLISYPILLAGTFLLLHRHSKNHAAALFGAICFTFGSFNLLHFVHPNAIAVVAHLPWMLWLVGRLQDQLSRILDCSANWSHAVRIGCMLALLSGSQLLLGYPQYVWYSLLAEGAYVLATTQRAELRSVLSVFSTVKLLGICLGAVQILPTVDALSESTRAMQGAEFTSTGSLHPLNLVQLFAPYLFEHRVVGQNTHELGLYFGAVPCVLIAWFILQPTLWGDNRRLVLTLLVALMAATLFAMGEFGPLYGLQQWLPLVNKFRFPCRAIVLMQLVLAALTTISFATFLARPRPDFKPRTVLWFPFIISLVLAGLAPLLWKQHVATAAMIWTGPLLFATATLLWQLSLKGLPIARYALIALAVADLVGYGASYAVLRRAQTIEQYIAQSPRPPVQDESRVIADVSIKNLPLEFGNQMLLAPVARIDGYAGLEPRRGLDYSDHRQLQLAGVGWIFNSQGGERERWTRLPAPAARARLVAKTISGDNFAGWTDAMFADTALVQNDLPLSDAPLGAVRLVSDRSGDIELVTDAASEQLLVLNETFHAGWLATINGLPVPVMRVNLDFMGCTVPAGQHSVRFVFSPQSLRLGKAISMGGLGLLVVAASATGLRRPRVPKSSDHSSPIA